MPLSLRNPWFHRPRPVERPRVRLWCLPYAGGAATAFHTWPGDLPDDIEVVAIALPGRSFRLREPPYRRMTDLVTALLKEMTPHLRAPYVIFGHSMGAAIGYELCQRLAASGEALPATLLVSGRRAPHVPPRGEPLYRLPDQQFMANLRDFYGTPDEVLRNRELQELVLPALRADLELLETWTSPEYAPLPAPIAAFAGEHDVGVDIADVEAWRQHTSSSFVLHTIPGDHMFLHGAQAGLLSLVAGALGS